MVLPISKEILARLMPRKEHPRDFLSGSFACRRDLRQALQSYKDKNIISFWKGDFSGYGYDIRQEDGTSATRVFCGAKKIGDPESDVMLRVSIHPAYPEGVGAEKGFQEYILKNDNTIVVNEDKRVSYWIDGEKEGHLAVLTKVQALAEEVKAKLDALILKKAPSIAS